MDGIQDLFNELGMRDMLAKDVLIGWRRLGKKNNDENRPLLPIFKMKVDRDRFLDRASQEIQTSSTRTSASFQFQFWKRSSRKYFRGMININILYLVLEDILFQK